MNLRRISYFFALVSLVLFALSCQGAIEDQPIESPIDANNDSLSLTASARPIVLVPGAASGMMKSFTKLTELKKLLVQAGKPQQHIYELNYDNNIRSDLGEMASSLQNNLRQILARYPSGQTFDIIAHSMGHYVALDAVLKAGLGQRVKKYVGIAGVAFGQSTRPWWCSLMGCGDAFEKLIPVRNPFIMQMMQQNKATIMAMQKCSVYSPDDGMIDPYDAGKFPDGVNIQIEDTSHLKLVKSPEVVDRILRECYNGTW